MTGIGVQNSTLTIPLTETFVSNLITFQTAAATGRHGHLGRQRTAGQTRTFHRRCTSRIIRPSSRVRAAPDCDSACTIPASIRSPATRDRPGRRRDRYVLRLSRHQTTSPTITATPSRSWPATRPTHRGIIFSQSRHCSPSTRARADGPISTTPSSIWLTRPTVSRCPRHGLGGIVITTSSTRPRIGDPPRVCPLLATLVSP